MQNTAYELQRHSLSAANQCRSILTLPGVRRCQADSSDEILIILIDMLFIIYILTLSLWSVSQVETVLPLPVRDE